MKKYLVLHYSNNWLYNPVMKQFNELKQAKEYVSRFRAYSGYHKNDSYLIVEVLKEGQIQHKLGMYRFE